MRVISRVLPVSSPLLARLRSKPLGGLIEFRDAPLDGVSLFENIRDERFGLQCSVRLCFEW